MLWIFFVIATLCLVVVSDERMSFSFNACFNCLGDGVATEERGLLFGRLGDRGKATALPNG